MADTPAAEIVQLITLHLRLRAANKRIVATRGPVERGLAQLEAVLLENRVIRARQAALIGKP